MLGKWCEITEREYPDLVNLLPKPEEIDINKLVGGGIMTDTCNAAQAMNRKLSREIHGVTHNLFCWNHLQNG
jgi:hypothetical protein